MSHCTHLSKKKRKKIKRHSNDHTAHNPPSELEKGGYCKNITKRNGGI